MAKKQQKKVSNFQKLYKSLSDSQKSLFAMYRQMSVCLCIPGNQKICDCIAAYYAEAQTMPALPTSPADSAPTSERSEQVGAASADGSFGGKE